MEAQMNLFVYVERAQAVIAWSQQLVVVLVALVSWSLNLGGFCRIFSASPSRAFKIREDCLPRETSCSRYTQRCAFLAARMTYWSSPGALGRR